LTGQAIKESLNLLTTTNRQMGTQTQIIKAGNMQISRKELLLKDASLDGYAYLQEDDNSNALKLYDKATEIDPDNAKAWYNKGYVTNKLGDYDNAIQCYDKAIQLDITYVLPWINKGYVLYKLARYSEAIQCYDKALEINPNFAFVWYSKGTALSYLDTYSSKKEPRDNGVQTHTRLARYGQAVRRFDSAITKLYDTKLYNKEHNYVEAIQCYDKAIELYPYYTVAWNDKGVAIGRVDIVAYQEVMQCYDKALEQDPNFALIWSNKGAVFYNLGKYDEAVSSCDRAIELDPNLAIAWHNKGVALHKFGCGMRKETKQCLKKAEQLGFHRSHKSFQYQITELLDQ
jgi:tetratricopeptide (TPR) repeat protein